MERRLFVSKEKDKLLTMNGNPITLKSINSDFQFYEVEIINGKFYHDGEELNYLKLVDKFNDNSYFLYLKYQNLIYIPSIETNDALAFSVAWTRREDVGDSEYAQPYISRVIVNNDDVIRSEQTGIQTLDLLLDSYDNYEEQYGDKMVPTANAVKEISGTKLYLHKFSVGNYSFSIISTENNPLSNFSGYELSEIVNDKSIRVTIYNNSSHTNRIYLGCSYIGYATVSAIYQSSGSTFSTEEIRLTNFTDTVTEL